MNTNILKSYKDTTFFILGAIVCYTVIVGLFTAKPFNWHVYVGIGAVLLCAVLMFVHYRLYKYLFLVVLLGGLFNLLQFTLSNTTVSFYVGIFKIINIETVDVQLLSLSLLILHGIFYRKLILSLIKKMVSKSKEEKQDELESQIAIFERKFRDMPKEQLEEMLEDKKNYSEVALTAVERLLNQ